MGLIKAFVGAFSSTMADQWKEYFNADAMSSNVICMKGVKQTGKNSSNTKGSDNVISKDSVIVVNPGQVAIIVENGLIVDFVAEPGGFTFDKSSSPSLFSGNLGTGIINTFKEIGKRFTSGGDALASQYVYYLNTKELTGNKFGTAQSVPYDDPVYQSIKVRYFGSASLKLSDPLRFYNHVCGNVKTVFTMDEYWQSQLLNEFVMNLTQALALLACEGIKYNQIPQRQVELAKHMNSVVDEEWIQARGLMVMSTGIASITLDPTDQKKVDQIDQMRLMTDPSMAAARLAGAQANAMEAAAGNSAGAMTGFMGLGMANNSQGGANVSALYEMGSKAKPAGGNEPAPKPPQPLAAGGWACACGEQNTGKFCSSCGKERPVPTASNWKCSKCGTENTGKFCSDCGAVKSSEWKCTCGKTNTGKFCSDCGAASN